jgi:hypothetical protein
LTLRVGDHRDAMATLLHTAIILGLAALLTTACGSSGTTPTARPSLPPQTAPPAPSAPTATPDPTRIHATGTVQDNNASSHVLTLRTSDGLWYVPWANVALVDGARGSLAPADIPIGAAVAFEGVPDPLAKTPTLTRAAIHIQ